MIVIIELILNGDFIPGWRIFADNNVDAIREFKVLQKLIIINDNIWN